VCGAAQTSRPPPGVRKASYAAVCEGSARANFPPRSAVTAAVTMPVLVLGWDCGDTIHPPSSVHELKASPSTPSTPSRMSAQPFMFPYSCFRHER
jgi:hypothetical protein